MKLQFSRFNLCMCIFNYLCLFKIDVNPCAYWVPHQLTVIIQISFPEKELSENFPEMIHKLLEHYKGGRDSFVSQTEKNCG